MPKFASGAAIPGVFHINALKSEFLCRQCKNDKFVVQGGMKSGKQIGSQNYTTKSKVKSVIDYLAQIFPLKFINNPVKIVRCQKKLTISLRKKSFKQDVFHDFFCETVEKKEANLLSLIHLKMLR